MKESTKEFISKGVALVEADVIVPSLVGFAIGTVGRKHPIIAGIALASVCHATLTTNVIQDAIDNLAEANYEQLTLIEDGLDFIGKKLCKKSKED